MQHEFQVSGMSCQHCVRAVTTAVQTVDPAATVAVDLAAGTVRVDSAAQAARIAGAIREEGYAVKPSGG